LSLRKYGISISKSIPKRFLIHENGFSQSVTDILSVFVWMKGAYDDCMTGDTVAVAGMMPPLITAFMRSPFL